MNMQTKIIFFVSIGVILLILDNHFLRIGQMESGIKENKLLVERRLLSLEEKIKEVPDLNNRIDRMEKHSLLMYEAYGDAKFLQAQIFLEDKAILDILLEKHGIFVFRTKQTFEAVDDTYMKGEHKKYAHLSYGGNSRINIGTSPGNYVFRCLIRFNEIDKLHWKKRKVLDASIYLSQFDRGDWLDDNALKEKYDIFLIKKHWVEGNQSGEGGRKEGEVSWLMVSEGRVPWAKPGCSDEVEDYDPMIVASSGANINANSEGWVSFRFTKEGLQWLQKRLTGEDNSPYHGFLIKSSNENKEGTLVSFRSSNYEMMEERPYIKIYYMKIQ